MTRAQAALGLAALAAVSGQAAAQSVPWMPSCREEASAKTAPGASDHCVPARLRNQLAFDVLKAAGAQRIAAGWVVVSSQAEWDRLDFAGRWALLSEVVSAVLSLHDDASDVYLVARPVAPGDQAHLAAGLVPPGAIIARARHDAAASAAAIRNRAAFPPEHHPRVYVLIVN